MSDFILLNSSLLPSSARGYRDESPVRGTQIAYFVTAVLSDGREIASPIVALSVPPAPLVLEQNAPNPFNPSTTIAFTLPSAVDVELSIYDIEGRLVRTLLDGPSQSGRHESRWDGADMRGGPVSSGIYVYRLRAGTTTIARKMLMLK
jgi:hypothetical protein